MSDQTPTPAEAPKRCGHHETVLTYIHGHGLRCPWCYPEFFPEHRFLVKFAEMEAFAATAGFRVERVPDDQTVAEARASIDWLRAAGEAIRLEVPAAVGHDVRAGMKNAAGLLERAFFPEGDQT
jgi:hypothetical protein